MPAQEPSINDNDISLLKKLVNNTAQMVAGGADINLQTEVSGVLPVANGGSGASSLTGILKGNGTSPFTPAVAGTDYLPITGGTGVTTLGTIATGVWHGTAIDVATYASGILPADNGGTANGFTAFSGPAGATKTFTLPNVSATILTDNAVVTVAQGGTGAVTLTGLVKGNGVGAFTAAVSGTDYLPITGGSGITTLGTIGTGVWQGTAVGVAYGGTGQTSYTDGQILIGNSTGNTLAKASLTGTANQIVVTPGAGSITLSLPQSIATSSGVQFAEIGVGVGSSTASPINILSSAANATRSVTIKNANGGTAAKAQFIADAGAGQVLFGANSAGFTTSGMAVQDAGFLFSDANMSGGMYISSLVAAPIVFGVNNAEVGRFNTSNNFVITGSIATGAPNGGTSGAWKTGILVTAAVTPDTTRYIELDVGGTLYKVIVST